MSEEGNDVAVDTNTEVEGATESNENSVEGTEVEGTQEDTDTLKVELEKQRKANLEINIARKKAEAELKKLKSDQAQSQLNNNSQLSDELKLIARGLSDEEIEQAKIIAKGKDIPLTEAIKNPLFLSYQKDFKDNERKEKAKLGASKGSGESENEDLIKPDMTREEHEKVFKKVMGV